MPANSVRRQNLSFVAAMVRYIMVSKHKPVKKKKKNDEG